jgi:predicted RNase H-like HicB family nuclease
MKTQQLLWYSSIMTNIVQMLITHEDGAYIAAGVNVPVFTEGNTFEELEVNIREAVELYFEGESLEELGFGPHPTILTTFELIPNLHGVEA